MRRGLLPIVGQKIVDAIRPPCSLRPILIEPAFSKFRKRLCGRTVMDVGRRGKRVLLHLCDHSIIVIEPRMTGLVLLADPPGEAHLRLRIRFAPPDNVAFEHNAPNELLFWDRRGLGTVRWLAADQIEGRLGAKQLGPDALEISLDALILNLRTSSRPVKVALLDQKRIAGIGNLYASEILFLAGVDPRTRCDKLSRPQWTRIHSAISAVLNDAILHEGSTLSDGTYRNALNNPGGYQNHHRVYDRRGDTCVRCFGAEIQRIVQAQRSTFFCPNCQQRRGMHELIMV
jgi:formamidopyrimidine-DNA glycosylase